MFALMWPVMVSAQLSVTASPPKIVGQKAVVSLLLTNGLAESVESARAVVFLLDEQGKMVGQGTRWIIGGSGDIPGLHSKATNTFHFVIESRRPFATTNLSTRVSVSRLLLQGGKSVDPKTTVIVSQAPK